VDHAKLFVDGKIVIDYSTDLEPGTFWFSFCHKEKKAIVTELKAGTPYRLELRCWSTGKLDLIPVIVPATFQIGAVLAVRDEDRAIQDAVRKAAAADLTILVVGLSADYETEGADQRDMT
jgi:beta-glucosidase